MTIESLRDAVAVASLSLLAACSSTTAPAPGIADAALPLADASAADSAAAAEVAADGAEESGYPALGPVTPAAPVVGDGKLPDVPDENPGGTPVGWDSCQSGLAAAPRPGKSDPPASRGERYWLFSPADPFPPTDPARPLAYFYFNQRLGTSRKGLWFDAMRVSGSAVATLELQAVDEFCAMPVPLGTFSLSPLLGTPGRWTTTCVQLPASLLLRGLGIRVRAEDAEVGLDAFRFGPLCPSTR